MLRSVMPIVAMGDGLLHVPRHLDEIEETRLKTVGRTLKKLGDDGQQIYGW